VLLADLTLSARLELIADMVAVVGFAGPRPIETGFAAGALMRSRPGCVGIGALRGLSGVVLLSRGAFAPARVAAR
jgi:hypothetical protein